MLTDDTVPERGFVSHHFGQFNMLPGPDFHPEIGGDLWPEIFPSDEIAVGDIERLIGAAAIGCHPHQSSRKQSRVRALIESVVVLLCARVSKGHSKRLGDGGVDGKNHHEVHRIARRESANRMWASR